MYLATSTILQNVVVLGSLFGAVSASKSSSNLFSLVCHSQEEPESDLSSFLQPLARSQSSEPHTAMVQELLTKSQAATLDKPIASMDSPRSTASASLRLCPTRCHLSADLPAKWLHIKNWDVEEWRDRLLLMNILGSRSFRLDARHLNQTRLALLQSSRVFAS